jgi:hypothetical protein
LGNTAVVPTKEEEEEEEGVILFNIRSVHLCTA